LLPSEARRGHEDLLKTVETILICGDAVSVEEWKLYKNC
jgi:hypothetical protein